MFFLLFLAPMFRVVWCKPEQTFCNESTIQHTDSPGCNYVMHHYEDNPSAKKKRDKECTKLLGNSDFPGSIENEFQEHIKTEAAEFGLDMFYLLLVAIMYIPVCHQKVAKKKKSHYALCYSDSIYQDLGSVRDLDYLRCYCKPPS